MLKHNLETEQKPRRVVVIGASGFVGNSVSRALENRGVLVKRVGRKDVDLLSNDAVDRLVDIFEVGDAVVAVSAIAPCKTSEMLRDNIQMALSMTQALSECSPAHVVNVSSDAVYADEPIPLTERSPLAPDSLHGVMHLAREIMMKENVSAPLAIVRPSLLYGREDPHNGYGPNKFRRQALAGDPITLFGEGEERRDHVHIDDVGEIISKIVLRRSEGLLNIATGQVSSFFDIATKSIELISSNSKIQRVKRNGPMPHNGYRPFDVEVCKKAFPEFKYISLEDGILNTLEVRK